MGLTAYRAAAKARIDAELKLRAEQWFATLPPPHADALRTMLTEGKRLRGSLTCLVAEALGGTLEQALPAALAVEMVQAASLVHDDFVDGDTVRRGRRRHRAHARRCRAPENRSARSLRRGPSEPSVRAWSR